MEKLVLILLCIAVTSQLGSGHWKNQKYRHGQSLDRFAAVDTHYFANEIVNERDFENHLDNILIPRVPGTEGSRKVRSYISNTLERLGYEVEISSSHQNTPVGEVLFQNIIATLDPRAPRRLVLACHYDSKKDPVGFLGATDSAVPCAQIINLAYTMRRDLNDHKNQGNDVTLQLIFFDGEEAFVEWRGNDNTYGARDLAKRWKSQSYVYDNLEGTHLDRMDMLVLLDLIGAKNPNFIALQRNTSNWFSQLVRIERQLDRENSLNRNSRRGQFMFTDPKRRAHFSGGIEDDHIPFQERGVPILHLITLPFPDVWHKMGDNKSAIDFRTVADLNKIFRVFVAEYLQLQK